jgi:hypothetical protein
MKKLNYILSAAVLVFMLAIISCGGSDDPGVPADDQIGAKLTSTWNATSVIFGTNQDRTTDYSGFKLTLGYNAETNAGTYSITGGPSDGTRPFATSGTWTFQGTISDPAVPSFNIVRDDTLLITVSELTATTLQLTFVFDGGTHSTSKTEAVDGTWVFDFSK